IVRQLLTESLLLSTLGGILGVLLAFGGVRLLAALTPSSIPRVSTVSVDPRALVFTLVVALITGMAFGVAPALQASRPDLNDSLKEGGRGSTGRRHRLRDVLIVFEVAFALVLLVGAGLMIRSIVRLYQVDLGLNPDKVLAMNMDPPTTRYPRPEQRIAF